jgi:hypothetical protein
LVAALPATFQVMRVLPSMRNSFARDWMASTSEIVKPVMKSPRALHRSWCQRTVQQLFFNDLSNTRGGGWCAQAPQSGFHHLRPGK